MRISLSIVALLAAAACSNSGSTGGGTAGEGDVGTVANGDSGLTFTALATASAPTADPAAIAFAAEVDNLVADAADINGKPLVDYNFTAFVGVPETGTASYSGLINVNAGPTANLSAGLTLDADFAAASLTAEQTTAFYADNAGALEAYTGDLDFSNGVIGARGVENSARLDIAGTLIGGANTVVVDGEIFGKLVGTPIVGISANTTVAEAAGYTNTERAMNITLNGTAVTEGSAGFVVIDDTLR